MGGAGSAGAEELAVSQDFIAPSSPHNTLFWAAPGPWIDRGPHPRGELAGWDASVHRHGGTRTQRLDTHLQSVGMAFIPGLALHLREMGAAVVHASTST